MNSGKKVIIAGGSGFLGRHLARELSDRGYEVVVLSRNAAQRIDGARVIEWDGRTVGSWAGEFEGARGIINLAGKNVNCRYTPGALEEIDKSRVQSVRAVGDSIHRCQRPPEVWVQAGSLAIYGDAGDRWCPEGAPPGDGIPVRTCLRWEQALAETPTPRTRRVLFRISFVLGREMGALGMLAGLTRWFFGGAIGSGRQFISWIHLADMNRLFVAALENESMSGIYNATSPNPVTNAAFMRELRRVLGRPWCPPMPAWLVPVGCWLLRTEPILALTGRRGEPRRLNEAQFEFKFPDLREALVELYSTRKLP
jgi:uncharacterized protein